MKKFDKNNYKFIDLSKTDYTAFSAFEQDQLLMDTQEVLKCTKGKMSKTPMNLALVAGYLAMRGGEFKKVNAFGSKWKKGNTTKEERKLVKKVLTTAQFYYIFKIVIILITKQDNNKDILNPTVVQKIK